MRGADEVFEEERDGLVGLSVIQRQTGDRNSQHWIETVASQERYRAPANKPVANRPLKHRRIATKRAQYFVAKYIVISGSVKSV